MELKEKTQLSSRTLAKHLSQMTNLRYVEKKTDVESGKYPYPVFYKVDPDVNSSIKTNIVREEIANGLEPALNESKDPLFLLDGIHANSQLYFIDLLRRIQQDKNATNEDIYFWAEYFLWSAYKQYTYKLIQASRKIINDLNINQLLINQAKRQIEIFQTALKIYEKTEQKNVHDIPRNSR